MGSSDGTGLVWRRGCIVLLAALLGSPAIGQERDGGDPPFTTVVVTYEVGGTMIERMGGKFTKTLYLDQEHSRWAEVTEAKQGSHLRVSDGTWMYDVDPATKTGTKQWLSRFQQGSNSAHVREKTLIDAGFTKAGTEAVASVTCDRWEMEDNYSKTTRWVWKGVPMGMRMASSVMPMETIERAIQIEVDGAIPEERFQIPEDIAITEDLIPGFELLKALATDTEPEASGGSFDRTSLGRAEEPFAYPGIEPFQSSRVWNYSMGEPGSALDIDRSVSLIAIQLMSIRAGKDAGDKYLPAPDPGAPNAELLPEVSDAERVWWMLVPRIVSELAPLYENDHWSDTQIATAREAGRFLALKPHGPRLDLASGTEKEWQAELKVLGHWYRLQLEHPERFAAMLFTTDYGPYAGVAYEAKSPLPAKDTVTLDSAGEFRLCEVDGPDPFVVQLVTGDRVLWSRAISDAPHRSVSRVELLEQPPERLGEHGWKVHLLVEWNSGAEYAHLYLDAKAGFLFYFISW